MPLQQTTFENIVAKGEIAHDEQFILLSQCFQLNSIINIQLKHFLLNFVKMFSKSSAAECLDLGKGFQGLSDYYLTLTLKSPK